jgi:cell division initiation protein
MQRLTPLDIQKQVFGKSLHGYSVDEVRGYLHVVAEELERLLRGLDELTRDNGHLRESAAENSERERILKETLLSAQRVSEEVKANARKEAELIVKDAEILADRIVSQAMERVGDLERKIQDLKIDRKAVRNKLHAIVETFQQLVALDAEEEANETPITHLHRKITSNE